MVYQRIGDVMTRQITRSEAGGDSTLAHQVRVGSAALEGRALMLRGDDDDARRMLEPAFAEGGMPTIAVWMADLLDRQGEEETAIRYLETFPPDAFVALRLAPLYEEVGDLEKARDAYSWIIAAWDEADPVLMVEWREARSKLAGLGGLQRQ